MREKTKEKEIYQVADTYDNNRVMVEGTYDTCYFWIVSHMEEIDGRKIYRYWEEDGVPHYDIGTVVTIVKKGAAA